MKIFKVPVITFPQMDYSSNFTPCQPNKTRSTSVQMAHVFQEADDIPYEALRAQLCSQVWQDAMKKVQDRNTMHVL